MKNRPSDLEYIVFDNRNSLDFNLGIVSVSGLLSTPERDITKVSCPGSDGDLIIDNGSFKNVSIDFEAYILPESPQFKAVKKSLDSLCMEIKDWLIDEEYFGYKKLMSSRQPGYYRYGKIDTKLDIEDIFRKIGSCTLTFDCKPYIYNEAGDIKLYLTQNKEYELLNPEKYKSKPVITLIGNGNATVTINDIDYEITSVSDKLVIDCERKIVYNADGVPETGKLKLINNEFPVFVKGTNFVKFTTLDSGIKEVVIEPKWRRI